MKKELFLASTLAIFALSLASCSEKVLETDPVEKNILEDKLPQIVYPKVMANTRGTSDNFWESWTKVTLASGSIANVPWNKVSATTTCPSEIATDIKYDAGWRLIAYTVNECAADDGTNYLIFHNVYTGVLKVFYYLESAKSQMQNNAVWLIKTSSPTSLFAFNGDYAKLSSVKEQNGLYLKNIVDDPTEGFSVGWNCFMVELAYDPDLPDCYLDIIPYSQTETTMKFKGSIEMETTGMIVSTTNKNILSKPISGVAKFAGKSAENWVKKAINEGNKKIFKKLSSLAVNGAGSIVSSGVSSLLGSFLGGFNKSNETTQAVQLSTDGTFSIEGSSISYKTGLVNPLRITLNKDTIGSLGSWCLTDEPYFEISPYATFSDKSQYASAVINYVTYIGNRKLTKGVVINPDLRSAVKSITLSGDLYQSSKAKRRVLHNGTTYSYLLSKGQHLYNDKSSPVNEITIGVPFKYEDGTYVDNNDIDAPYEIFIPTAPDGTKGAVPDFGFNSDYIDVITVMMTTRNGDTMVSTHTYVPDVKWNIDELNNGLYLDEYPAVPILNKNN